MTATGQRTASACSGLTCLCAAITLALTLAICPRAQSAEYGFSIGVSYSRWSPNLDTYNDRWAEQTGWRDYDLGNGTTVQTFLRFPIDTLDWKGVTIFKGSSSEYTVTQTRYRFSSSSGIGASARLYLPLNLSAGVEADFWQQEIASARNYGGLIGYEAYDIRLVPLALSATYTLPTGDNVPTAYLSVGAGVLLVRRTLTQVTNATPPGGLKHEIDANNRILCAAVGTEYTPPVLQNRLSFFAEGRYLNSSFDEPFVEMDDFGTAILDDNDNPVTTVEDVDITSTQVKIGIRIRFGGSLVADKGP